MTTPANHVITNDVIKDLRNFSVRVHQEYLDIKPFLGKDESVSDLQLLYSEINAKIISMRKYLCYIEVDCEKESDIKDVCKNLNLLLYDCGNVLEKMGVEKRHSDYEDIYGSKIKEIQNGIFKNRGLLSNYREIEKEFLDYIKVESKKSTIENETAFKVGLLFATGVAQEKIKELRGINYSWAKIAAKFDFKESDQHYFNYTYNNTANGIRNICSREDVILALENHFNKKESNEKMCQDFINEITESRKRLKSSLKFK